MPRGARETVPSIRKADWSNPSARTFIGRIATTTEDILHQFTLYYTALFARKEPEPTAKAACLRTLREGNRVLPPTAAACDADITADEVLAVLKHLRVTLKGSEFCLQLTKTTSRSRRSPDLAHLSCQVLHWQHALRAHNSF